MLNLLRSARLLAGLTLFALGLPLVVQACTMEGMDMWGMDSAHHAVTHDRDAGSESEACHSAPEQETLQRQEPTCCGQSSIASEDCAPDGENSKPTPLICDCHAVDAWLVVHRSNDAPDAALVLHETGAKLLPPVPASQIAHSSLKDPGSLPLDRIIVFGSFLT